MEKELLLELWLAVLVLGSCQLIGVAWLCCMLYELNRQVRGKHDP